MTLIRDVVAADREAIVRLNEAEVAQTSPMDPDRLDQLLAMCRFSKVATVDQEVVAFLIAFREGAPYDSDNYLWFAQRFERFFYIDRIVVESRFAGQGIGRRLYADLFAHARREGIGTITCEFNIQPPNPASQAFHDKLGFRELGTQWVAAGTKQVSLQAAEP